MAFTDGKLSNEIRRRVLNSVDYSVSQREEIFDKFATTFLKLGSGDIENAKKSFVILEKTGDRKRAKFNTGISSKKLTYKARRELGLYTLSRKGLKYTELLQLHKLWAKYMTKYMNLDQLREQKWTNNPADPNYEQVNQKLYRADFHGSEMTVVRSKCYSLIGKSGIVVMETKNAFKLLGKDNIIRTIPKASSVFTFSLNDFNFTFFGKNLSVRPAERSSKKLKKLYINDL